MIFVLQIFSLQLEQLECITKQVLSVLQEHIKVKGLLIVGHKDQACNHYTFLYYKYSCFSQCYSNSNLYIIKFL